MNFLFPVFLVAFAAVAVPVIIHLFRFRRFKRVYFTNVSLLREIDITRKNRQRLKHLLVLLMRALAIAALVFAFAKPFLDNIPGAARPGTRFVSIYIDNSFSMDREGENGNLLNQAKQLAEEIANAYNPTDRFQLSTNDFEGRHARFYSRDEFLNLVAETDFSSAARTVSEVANRQRDMLNKDGNDAAKRIYLLSDFAESITDLANIQPDSGISLSLLPLKAAVNTNLYIDSIWLETPATGVNIPLTLKYRIRNTGELDAEDIAVRLTLNGEQKTPSTANVPGNGFYEGELFFTVTKSGSQNGKVQIEDPSLEFDNDFYFSFNVSASYNVLVINESVNRWVDKVFENDPYFRLTSQKSTGIDYSSFPDQNLIILAGIRSISGGMNTELKKYAENGGNIVILPGPDAALESLNGFSSSLGSVHFSSVRTGSFKAEKVNTEGTFFSDIFESVPRNPDLPSVSRYYPTSGGKNVENVIKLNTGDALYAYTTLANGSKVFVSSTPLDDQASNFHKHALFVPILLKTAFLSQRAAPLYYFAGSSAPAEVPVSSSLRTDEAVKWKQTETGYEFIPEQRRSMGKLLFYPGEYLEQAGNYRIILGNEELSSVAYNYPRTESSTLFFDDGELRKQLEEYKLPHADILRSSADAVKKSIEDNESGTSLWKWFVIAALLFFLGEVLLLRFWK